MDKELRNRIQRAAQDARRLLERDFAEQLEGIFDIHLDGTVAGTPGEHLDAAQRIVRGKLVAVVQHLATTGQPPAEAVATCLREAAFTTLNRFVALKMLEARGLLQECISRGEQSSGFKEFSGLAPGLGQISDRGYRLYIESLFDELSTQIQVLFNRRDAGSLLWPRRATLEQLLAGLNAPELAGVWADDETIGWVYQYYNDEAERKRMREKSAAPRNSRELAVRNQFFTPRYVVEFLTDNTLGRLWYEMTQGQTHLKERCRYLVRRPNEIFLRPGESAPEDLAGRGTKFGENLSQEELFRQPVYIPHRLLKDPRAIRLLDPACGSMHFGLYAFDLFEVIYEEAWDLAAHTVSGEGAEQEGLRPLQELYQTKGEYLRDVPRLIIEHNLHGVDIDRRAVQIAGLSLWLRAQRAWQEAGVKPAERPRVTRSNIVCAEPMPGEREMLREFVAHHFLPRERPAFAFLLEKVFDRMTLAGEAGSLLRIEEEIRDAVAATRALAQQQAEPQQLRLLLGREQSNRAKLDLSGLNEEQFWQAAEQRIYDALKVYAEQAENGSGFRRRLFAGDAAQGFAFINLCRRRYDVVVMNPPFGDSTVASARRLESYYLAIKHDLASSFLERAVTLLGSGGLVGAIVTRTLFFLQYLRAWREEFLFESTRLVHFVDLGYGVLEAMVETAALCFGRKTEWPDYETVFLTANTEEARRQQLMGGQWWTSSGARLLKQEELRAIPGAPMAYRAPKSVLALFRHGTGIESESRGAYTGALTQDDFRFTRAWWEVPEGTEARGWTEGTAKTWVPYVSGGSHTPIYADYKVVIKWERDGRELKAFLRNYREAKGFSDQWTSQLNSYNRYFSPGVIWSLRPLKQGSFWILPAGCIFGNNAPALICEPPGDALWMCGVMNSSVFRGILGILMPRGNTGIATLKYNLGYVRAVPLPRVEETEQREISRLVARAWSRYRELDSFNETSRVFSGAHVGTSELQSCLAGRLEELWRDLELIEDISRELFGVPEGELEQLLVDTGVRRCSENLDLNPILAFSAEYEPRMAVRSFSLGVALGRWRQRQQGAGMGAVEEFEPLGVLPYYPASLGQHGMSGEDVGVAVEDVGHERDVGRLMSSAIGELGLDGSDVGEELESRETKLAGLFIDHVSLYVAGKRKAPIYWQLASQAGTYAIWLYYHSLKKDTFYRVLNEYISPKLQREERRLSGLTESASSGVQLVDRRDIDEQATLVADLRAFREEVARIAPLWNPDLNDGVLINFAPLWRLVPQHRTWQVECRECWEGLLGGKYDWAHLAMHLWPERVVPKCAHDHSLAIAHGLEAVFWAEDAEGRWQPRTLQPGTVERLVAERASPAVREALASLLSAPGPVAGRVGGRRKAEPAVQRAPRTRAEPSGEARASAYTVGKAADSASLDAVRAAIRALPGGAAKGDVMGATGLSDGQWAAAIAALLERGEVMRVGERRGARYYLAGATPPAPK